MGGGLPIPWHMGLPQIGATRKTPVNYKPSCGEYFIGDYYKGYEG